MGRARFLRTLAGASAAPARRPAVVAGTARWESSGPAAAVAAAESPPPPVTFLYPKARALFEKIVQTLSKEDVRRLADATGAALGRPLRPNEFYYVGFGGARGGGRRGGAAAEDAGAGDAAAAAAAVKTTVDLKLTGFDEKAKIKVIKEIRAIAGLGLKEAKELVEGAPKTVQKGLKPEAAEELKKKLEEVGAVIELV